MRSPEFPSLIPLSKRAHVFYLEHAKVVQKEERVLYLTQHGAETEHFFNVPQHNTALMLLGQGTSITDSAARMLAESGVTTAFAGTGGSPLHGGAEPVLLSPQSEYRATEYMQAWVQMWLDENKRLAAAKRFMLERARWVEEAWSADPELGKRGIVLSDKELDEFEAAVKLAASTESLMGHEAVRAKRLYAKLAYGFGLREFKRKGNASKRRRRSWRTPCWTTGTTSPMGMPPSRSLPLASASRFPCCTARRGVAPWCSTLPTFSRTPW